MPRSAQNVSPAFCRRVSFQPLCVQSRTQFELILALRDKHLRKLENIKTGKFKQDQYNFFLSSPFEREKESESAVNAGFFKTAFKI